VRTATRTFTLRRERTLAAALRVLRDAPGTVPLAGCTDVYVALQFGQRPGTAYLDLTPLRALRRIAVAGDRLVIGALATYTDLQRSRHVRARLPMLVDAARQVGGAQIQNRGTVGGNLANASPAGDTLPVFAAAEAEVVLQSTEGERRVPFTAFFTGYRETASRPGELITAVEVPAVEGRQWFRKVGTRAAQAISKVMLAGVRAGQPRLALGSVAPTVVRLPRTEASLGSGAPLEAALEALRAEIAPIDDLRSTADYRREVAVNLVREFWTRTA